MFKKLRSSQKKLQLEAPAGAYKLDAIQEASTLLKAVELLTTTSALMDLTQAEAQVVVRYMRPQLIAEGTVFIREGDTENTGFMALVLVGEVVVENFVISRMSPTTVTVQGPGSLLGELGLVDGLPRSASCTAGADLSCAILTRADLLQLLEVEPKIAAKLMMVVAKRTGERLRDNTQKLKKYAQLTQALQQEINHLTQD
jgi:CRP/FNR family cyclic AMP-dependent transcriptional regulator